MTTRVKYTGVTPGADSSTYTLFSTVAAFNMANAMQMAGLSIFTMTLDCSQAGTLKWYRSTDRGLNWVQVGTRTVTAPAAADAVYLDVDCTPFADFKAEWVNGGVAQGTWYPDIALSELREYNMAGLVSAEGLYARWIASNGTNIVTGVKDWLDTTGLHNLTQLTGANQPLLNNSDANFNGRATITFDGVNDCLASDEAPAAWTFMHRWAGSTIAVAYRTRLRTGSATHLLAGTGNNSGAELHAMNLTVVESGGPITRATARNRPDVSTTGSIASGTIAYDSTRWAVGTLRRSDRFAGIYGSGGLIDLSGTSIVADDATDPDGTFAVGSRAVTGNFLKGEIAEVIVYNKTVSSSVARDLGRYFSAYYGCVS